MLDTSITKMKYNGALPRNRLLHIFISKNTKGKIDKTSWRMSPTKTNIIANPVKP